MKPTTALVAASLGLLAVRGFACLHVGFGDAEALYAAYALHPQTLYLDHPGLVGSLARAIGGGAAPTPQAAHVVTTAAATALPWGADLAARALGAPRERAALAGLALVAAPEISVGLFAMTPDLLLAPLWLAALALVGLAVRRDPDEPTTLFAFLGAGAAAGLAFDAKVTGALLAFSLAAALVTPACRRHLRRPGPWIGAAMAMLVASPVVAAELGAGLPMLRHRLVDTQTGAGLSPRNALALVGGQLAYLTPLVFAAAALLARDLWRTAGGDPIAAVLRANLVVAGAPLALLCLWSRVAEPHWLAPALLPLPLWLALRPPGVVAPRLARWALATGLAAAALAHAWALTDLAPRLLGPLYTPRYDLANDLHAWAPTLPALRVLRAQAQQLVAEPVPVVTPHWTLAAQAAAGLAPGAAVGTLPGSHDDFARWLPAAAWQQATAVIWLSDDRFGLERPPALAARKTAATITLPITRGGRVVRRVRLELLVALDDA